MLCICTYVHYFSSVSVSLLTNHGDETVSRVSPAPVCTLWYAGLTELVVAFFLWLTLPVNSSDICSKRGHSHEDLPLIEIWINLQILLNTSPFYQNFQKSSYRVCKINPYQVFWRDSSEPKLYLLNLREQTSLVLVEAQTYKHISQAHLSFYSSFLMCSMWMYCLYVNKCLN